MNTDDTTVINTNDNITDTTRTDGADQAEQETTPLTPEESALLLAQAEAAARVDAVKAENDTRRKRVLSLLLDLRITKDRSFSEWMDLHKLDKSTDEGKSVAAEYNNARNRLKAATLRDSDFLVAKTTTSYNPRKNHKSTARGEVKEGTDLEEAENQIREERTALYFAARQEHKLSTESGIPDAAWLAISIAQGHIPRDYAHVSESGTRTFPISAAKDWRDARDIAILAERAEQNSRERAEYDAALVAAGGFIAAGGIDGLTTKNQQLKAINGAIRLAHPTLTVKLAEPIANRALIEAMSNGTAGTTPDPVTVITQQTAGQSA